LPCAGARVTIPNSRTDTIPCHKPREGHPATFSEISLRIREQFRNLLETHTPVWQVALHGSEKNSSEEGHMPPIRNRLRSVETPDGSVVLNVENGKMFRLNPMGMRILSLLSQGVPTDRISEEISREFGVDLETVREDVRNFFMSLNDSGLVDSDVTVSHL
jgi:DNA-binding CsgD family transcriptional regulator